MEPAKYPGSSGTRNLSDNLSDLKAQVAANQKVHVLATFKHCEIVSEMTKTLKISLKKFAIESWDFKFNAKVQK